MIEKSKHALMLLERQEITQAVNYSKKQNKRTRQVSGTIVQQLLFCMPTNPKTITQAIQPLKSCLRT